MISAKVIEASDSDYGPNLTTMQLTFPRFILPEFLTHRVFSRNASSSRAIPVKKMIDMVKEEPAMPIHWGKNQPGMQAFEELNEEQIEHAKNLWKVAAINAANVAEQMNMLGLHKQVANRILEPFQHIHVVLTSSQWDNFFELRDHEDAQPEIRALAIEMKKALDSAQYEHRGMSVHNPYNWHLPYVGDNERDNLSLDILKKISAARCCRVSYMKHDGSLPSIEEDLALFDRLAAANPKHYSPLEHQACPDFRDLNGEWMSPHLHGNLLGWIQFRRQDEMSSYNK